MRYKEHVLQASMMLFDVMATLEKLKRKIVFITDENGILLGSITDGDIRRYALSHHSFSALAKDVMKSPCVFAHSLKQAANEASLHGLSSIPIVDAKGKIIDIWFDHESGLNRMVDEAYRDTPIVMMAGGKGERLYPYTAVLPKPLIPIQGVPIAQRIMERFASAGLHRFILTLNYKKNIIKAYFDDVMADLDIHYYEEERPSGTAGSLRGMKDLLTQDFFLINCDNLIDVDLEELLRYHKEEGNVITVVSALKSVTIPYGVLDLEENGKLRQLREKPVMNQFINTGMYVVSPQVFSCFPDQDFFHMTDVIQICLEQNQKVSAYVINEQAFMDMGQMDELDKMQKALR